MHEHLLHQLYVTRLIPTLIHCDCPHTIGHEAIPSFYVVFIFFGNIPRIQTPESCGRSNLVMFVFPFEHHLYWSLSWFYWFVLPCTVYKSSFSSMPSPVCIYLLVIRSEMRLHFVGDLICSSAQVNQENGDFTCNWYKSIRKKSVMTTEPHICFCL